MQGKNKCLDSVFFGFECVVHVVLLDTLEIIEKQYRHKGQVCGLRLSRRSILYFSGGAEDQGGGQRDPPAGGGPSDRQVLQEQEHRGARDSGKRECTQLCPGPEEVCHAGATEPASRRGLQRAP